ncbi:unknown [Acidiphilium sp. CAG:727]|nr:unknown [Acidiphilium sp. CAG:727]
MARNFRPTLVNAFSFIVLSCIVKRVIINTVNGRVFDIYVVGGDNCFIKNIALSVKRSAFGIIVCEQTEIYITVEIFLLYPPLNFGVDRVYETNHKTARFIFVSCVLTSVARATVRSVRLTEHIPLGSFVFTDNRFERIGNQLERRFFGCRIARTVFVYSAGVAKVEHGSVRSLISLHFFAFARMSKSVSVRHLNFAVVAEIIVKLDYRRESMCGIAEFVPFSASAHVFGHYAVIGVESHMSDVFVLFTENRSIEIGSLLERRTISFIVRVKRNLRRRRNVSIIFCQKFNAESVFDKFERAVHYSAIVIRVYKYVVAVSENSKTVGVKRVFGQIDFAVLLFCRDVSRSVAERDKRRSFCNFRISAFYDLHLLSADLLVIIGDLLSGIFFCRSRVFGQNDLVGSFGFKHIADLFFYVSIIFFALAFFATVRATA